MQRKTWPRILAILSLSLSLVDVAYGQEPIFRRHPPGSVVETLRDTVQIVAGNNDTSRAVYIGGVDLFAYYVWYDARNDSTNIKLYVDLSADNIRWVSWRNGAYDSALVSGTADTERLLQFSSPPNYSFWARTRIDGLQATGDTVKVTLRWILQWLPQAINP